MKKEIERCSIQENVEEEDINRALIEYHDCHKLGHDCLNVYTSKKLNKAYYIEKRERDVYIILCLA